MTREFSDMNGHITGHAILENVRRYRGIASLYRQTAAFRPDQSWSLLEQAKDWEARALLELEAYFAARMDYAATRAARSLTIGAALGRPAAGSVVGSCTDTTWRLRGYLDARLC